MASQAPRSPPHVVPFDELLVVSNLCLSVAGAPLAADHCAALEDLLREIKARPPGRRVGLVLNGNTFDFASDGQGSGAFEPGLSPQRIDAILADNAGPIDVLRRLLQERDCRLVLVAGNREVDLVLPDVQVRLQAALCGDDPLARRRLVLAADGYGLACTAGQARVLLIHGHEADPYNHVDFVKLHDHLEACRYANQWQPWWPSAGHRLLATMSQASPRWGTWPTHMVNEELALGLILAKDPMSLIYLPALLRVAWAAQEKRLSLRRLPRHARVLPPPRIRYAEPSAVRAGWKGFSYGALLPRVNPPNTILSALMPGGAQTRLDRFGAALARARVSSARDPTVILEQVVRADVDLVVHGYWREPHARLMHSGGLQVCSGFWEPSILLGPEHARDRERFRQTCAALFSGSLEAMAEVRDLLMARYVTHVATRSDGTVVTLRRHDPAPRRFVGVDEMVLPVRR